MNPYRKLSSELDDIEAKLDDMWRKRKLAHRLEHPDTSDPDYSLENIQAGRYDWVPGKNWLQPAPKRGGVK